MFAESRRVCPDGPSTPQSPEGDQGTPHPSALSSTPPETIAPQDFEAVRRFVRDESAVVLEPGKEYLVQTRLSPLVRELKLTSIAELVAQARLAPGREVYRRIVEAMVTTETSFFRDHTPFEALRKTVIPDLITRRRDTRRLRIWCAASSTGQEPYSIALLLREHFPQLAGWELSLIASDLSREVLERARQGRYNQVEVNRGLPASFLVKYFDQHGVQWQLKSDIRSMVDFREINLALDWPALPLFDLVLIRNVMIYFEVETKKTILRKLVRLLQPDAYLLLGGAETTFNLDDSYRRVGSLRTGVYQLA
jgi:chemotaxis protein methyltransferase CheR